MSNNMKIIEESILSSESVNRRRDINYTLVSDISSALEEIHDVIGLENITDSEFERVIELTENLENTRIVVESRIIKALYFMLRPIVIAQIDDPRNIKRIIDSTSIPEITEGLNKYVTDIYKRLGTEENKTKIFSTTNKNSKDTITTGNDIKATGWKSVKIEKLNKNYYTFLPYYNEVLIPDRIFKDSEKLYIPKVITNIDEYANVIEDSIKHMLNNIDLAGTERALKMFKIIDSFKFVVGEVPENVVKRKNLLKACTESRTTAEMLADRRERVDKVYKKWKEVLPEKVKDTKEFYETVNKVHSKVLEEERFITLIDQGVLENTLKILAEQSEIKEEDIASSVKCISTLIENIVYKRIGKLIENSTGVKVPDINYMNENTAKKYLEEIQQVMRETPHKVERYTYHRVNNLMGMMKLKSFESIQDVLMKIRIYEDTVLRYR